MQGLAKAGTLSIIGVYPPQADSFPIGLAMNKNLTINMGNCHHRKYIPKLIELVLSRRIDPAKILTQVKPMSDAIAAFKAFDRRESGWIKVELHPQRLARQGSAEEEVLHEQVLMDEHTALEEAIKEFFPTSAPPTTTPDRRR